MFKYLILILIPITVMASSDSSSDSSGTVVNERRRSHAGRTLSIINGNPDFGVNTAEIRALYLRRQAEHEKLHADFLAAAQAGGDLTDFLDNPQLNVNVHNPEDGMTALMHVAKQGRLSVVQALMLKNAKAHAIKDKSGLCALDHATGHGDVRKFMLQNQTKDLSRRNSINRQEKVVFHIEEKKEEAKAD